MSRQGTLYVVPVPIGNLEDITLRAKRVLSEVELIACEDTRTTGKLLELLGVPRPRLLSTHDHNEEKRIPTLVEFLKEGRDIALVSDAGTPTISDPVGPSVGHRCRIRARLCQYAATTALCVAGLPTDRFSFQGFLPHNRGPYGALEFSKGPRNARVYVGPHHLKKVLRAAEVLGGDASRSSLEKSRKSSKISTWKLTELVAEPGTAGAKLS